MNKIKSAARSCTQIRAGRTSSDACLAGLIPCGSIATAPQPDNRTPSTAICPHRNLSNLALTVCRLFHSHHQLQVIDQHYANFSVMTWLSVAISPASAGCSSSAFRRCNRPFAHLGYSCRQFRPVVGPYVRCPHISPIDTTYRRNRAFGQTVSPISIENITAGPMMPLLSIAFSIMFTAKRGFPIPGTAATITSV